MFKNKKNITQKKCLYYDVVTISNEYDRQIA